MPRRVASFVLSTGLSFNLAGSTLYLAVATLFVWRTRIHLLWLIGAGALLGALGWV